MEPLAIIIPMKDGSTLHLGRFPGNPEGPPVFMVHGSIENGRIFWSRSGKGLAPYLAARGFDVYVADLRGRGRSLPSIDRSSTFGQSEAILEDIPAFIDAIVAIRGRLPQHWIAHSWGGVLLSSYLARFPERMGIVNSLVFFGSKRRVRAFSLEIMLKIAIVWKIICPISIAFRGYLPAAGLGFGSDSETARSYRDCAAWVRDKAWVDAVDGFDYGAAINGIELPPIWYIAGAADRALGHPNDVRDFMEESGGRNSRYSVLSRAGGNVHDYDHVDMLTHPDAARDHFPEVEKWLRLHHS